MNPPLVTAEEYIDFLIATPVYPTDYRLVDPAEAPKRTKNDLFRDMLAAAKARGLALACMCFDAWHSGLDNLKAARGHG